MAARSFLGAGDIYIELITGGVGQGLEGPFYANKLGVTPAVEVRQSTSKGRYDYGQVLETVNLQQPAQLALELKEVQGNVLAYALMGTTAAITQSSGTLTDQAVTIKKTKWVPIGDKVKLGSAIVVENSGGTVTYVEDTDYVLNRPLGLIKILSGSVIADNASLLVSGPYGAMAGTRVSGATQGEIRCRILFDGINQADGSEVTAEIYEAILSAESEFDFLPDDFGVVSMTGTAKTPAGKTAPFVVDIKA
jgi:hypothetical protein